MVLDQQRNDAYEGAIRRAVERKRAAGCTDLLALDVGAGSGLLSMMAARLVCVGMVVGWGCLGVLGGGGACMHVLLCRSASQPPAASSRFPLTLNSFR